MFWQTLAVIGSRKSNTRWECICPAVLIQKEHRWSKHKNYGRHKFVMLFQPLSLENAKSTLQSFAAKWSSRLFSCQSTTWIERICVAQISVLSTEIADKKFMTSLSKKRVEVNDPVAIREKGDGATMKGIMAVHLNLDKGCWIGRCGSTLSMHHLGYTWQFRRGKRRKIFSVVLMQK